MDKNLEELLNHCEIAELKRDYKKLIGLKVFDENIKE